MLIVVADSTVPTVALQLDGEDSRQQLWNKAKLTYRYIYQHQLDQFDWFFKGDTDTCVELDHAHRHLKKN